MGQATRRESFERRFFEGEDPIGRRIRWSGEEWLQVAGVVYDVKGFGMGSETVPAMYVSNRQTSEPDGTSLFCVLVRTSVPPNSMAGALRKELRQWNKQMPIGEIAAMDDLLSASVAAPRFYMLMVSAFAALALVITAIGVYGTISHSVVQRTHEIGVRMALGAERTAVLAMILREGASVIAAGAAIGLAGAWSWTRILESMLFGIRPHDLTALAGASTLLVVVGLAASYVPARHATRVDPVVALRCE